MNRSRYFDYIEGKINSLAYSINARGKLNVLNYNIHAENFYIHFLNHLYGWSLVNLNSFQQNIEAIDLIDTVNKYVVQVSSTSTKQKVEGGLDKDIIKKYSTFTFKFISISNDADNIKDKSFKNPHNISFTPKDDIIDKKDILNHILLSTVEEQKTIYRFVKSELGEEVDVIKLDSNLADVINILAKEDLSNKVSDDAIKSFNIDSKILHNQLNYAKSIISDYAAYYSKINDKYQEFDTIGSNKSISVLQSINKMYIETKSITDEPDSIFFKVIEKIMAKVNESANFIKIPVDELELCANIVCVDAFIRCKIFENPQNYENATS